MVSVNDMASSYITNLQQEVRRAEASLKDQQKYFDELSSHLRECIQSLHNSNNLSSVNANPVPGNEQVPSPTVDSSLPPAIQQMNPQRLDRVQNEDGTVTETLAVNPFLQTR